MKKTQLLWLFRLWCIQQLCIATIPTVLSTNQPETGHKLEAEFLECLDNNAAASPERESGQKLS